MSARSFVRGWEIVYRKGWKYSDTGEPVAADPRPCKKCGRMPTPEGHDACLGTLGKVEEACCGHGVTKPYIVYGGKKV